MHCLLLLLVKMQGMKVSGGTQVSRWESLEAAVVGEFPSVYGCGEEGDEEGRVPMSQAILQVCMRDKYSCSKIQVKKVVAAKKGWARKHE